MTTALTRDALEAFWMPFTANRQFKNQPRLLARAEGMHYWTPDGRKILDGCAGLWCVNAGHGRKEITAAVSEQLATLDFAPTFQMGHPAGFELANRLIKLTPGDLDHVFFTNSGSESVDTALKIALAYHRVKGDASRQRLIGREKGYHGVGFGGISVGGLSNNRKFFGSLLPGVDHLRHTLDIEHNAFTRGLPEWGVHLADDLERLVTLHDASTIAAVIVEPMQGSAGVILPPKGYLQKLRAICDKHGILLIFDEVITGFGRLGTAFGAQYFDVMPDIMTTAKGLTNGAIPMGAVFVRKQIYDAFMKGPDSIELFHGYTYSAHPAACAAGLATQEIYEREGLLTRGAGLAKPFEDAVHSLRSVPNVIDIRNIGLVAGIELEPRAGAPGVRAYEALVKCFEKGILIRTTGDTIALSPPLIISPAQIDELVTRLGEVLKTIA
ncbi:MAG TPA: aspartate aminotransferase family protein [Steroidobacter sp.]|uniref:aspartate aminotransferase family protein n=1 Tax=Steroidobacter sp. TaxID=1978227 RepID=UPI002ED88848